MRPNDSRGPGRRSGRRPRRPPRPPNDHSRTTKTPPAKKPFWQKRVSFFRPAASSPTTNGTQHTSSAAPAPRKEQREQRPVRKPEAVEVPSPKLYVGNLSYDAT